MYFVEFLAISLSRYNRWSRSVHLQTLHRISADFYNISRYSRKIKFLSSNYSRHRTLLINYTFYKISFPILDSLCWITKYSAWLRDCRPYRIRLPVDSHNSSMPMQSCIFQTLLYEGWSLNCFSPRTILRVHDGGIKPRLVTVALEINCALSNVRTVGVNEEVKESHWLLRTRGHNNLYRFHERSPCPSRAAALAAPSLSAALVANRIRQRRAEQCGWMERFQA